MMSLRQAVGAGLVASPILAIMTYGVATHGWAGLWTGLAAIGACAFFGGVVWVGFELLYSKDRNV